MGRGKGYYHEKRRNIWKIKGARFTTTPQERMRQLAKAEATVGTYTNLPLPNLSSIEVVDFAT